MDLITARRHRLRNAATSLALLAGMGGLLAVVARGLLGAGPLTVFVVVAVMALLAVGPASTRLALRLHGARPLPPQRAPALHAILAELARRAELPRVPSLHWIPDRRANAFSVGSRDDAAVAVSDGLLRALDRDELIGVLAHEVSHIRHHDSHVLGLAQLVSRLTVTLSRVGLVLVVFLLPWALLGELAVAWWALPLVLLAPVVAGVLQLALSRTREFDADRSAVELVGSSDGLASALARLEAGQESWWRRLLGLPSARVEAPTWMLSHPPTAERIRRLRQLAPPRPRRPVIDARGWLVRGLGRVGASWR